MKAGQFGWVAAASLLAVLHVTAASAAVYRLDETGTVVSEPVVQMHWQDDRPGGSREHAVAATMRVDVRLNVRPWLNRPSRIYLVFAPISGTRVSAEWTTHGRLLPGSLQSGERALVFEGPAGPATLTDTLRMRLETDGRRLRTTQRLDFHFEIEVDP